MAATPRCPTNRSVPLRAARAPSNSCTTAISGAALLALRTAKELGQLERVILGTDSPAGSGVQPLGVLRMIAMLSSLGELPAEQAFCFATGNTARIHGLTCGLIEPGRARDLVFLDRRSTRGGFTCIASRSATCRA